MIKRPLAVWIAQIVLLVLGIPLLLVEALLVISYIWLEGLEESRTSPAVVLLTPVVVCVIYLVAAWGMARRRPYGRWIGVASLLLPVALAFANRLLEPHEAFVDLDLMRCANLFDHQLRTVGMQIPVAVSLLFLSAYLMFSRNVKQFFGQSKVAPPPSTFGD